MSLIWFVFVLLVGLLLVKCQYTQCNRENIFQIVTGLLKKILSFLFDVFSFAIKRFSEISWFEEGGTKVVAKGNP
jgi:hypothetical protein